MVSLKSAPRSVNAMRPDSLYHMKYDFFCKNLQITQKKDFSWVMTERVTFRDLRI